MNPLAAGPILILCWAAIGFGLGLTFLAFLGLAKAPAVRDFTLRNAFSGAIVQLGNAVLLISGLAIVVAGSFAVYVALYRS